MLPHSTWQYRSRGWTLASVLLFMTAPARADLHFPQPSVEVGEGRCGAPLSHRFAFANRGPVPVEIVEVRASCGCLTPRLAQRVYQPGEAGILILEINTLSQAEGPHTWTCQVTCRSGDRRQDVPLQMTGRIIAEVTVQPAILTVFTDSAVAHELILTDRRPQALAVTGLESSSPRLLAKLGGPERNGQGHHHRRIRLEVAADCPEGRHEETLTLFTDDPLYRELRIPVTVVKRARARVAAWPAEVSLAADEQVIATRLLRLRDRQEQNVVIERITADDPAITCQWAPGPENQATLKVRIDRSRSPGTPAPSAIHVHLSQPVRETITIPVKVGSQ